MLHDQTAYPEPFSFKPERFLDDNGDFCDDPLLTSAFGFGRRLCPARHFVDSSLFIAFSCILSVFHIGPPKDEHGNEIPITLKDSGANSRYVRQAAPYRRAVVGAENKMLLMFAQLSFPVVH
jgi:cytochrome P450